MIKLKFNENSNSIDIYKDKDVVTTLNNQEFGELMAEIRKMIEAVNPRLEKRAVRRERIKKLKNNLKILLAVKFINLKNKIKWTKKK